MRTKKNQKLTAAWERRAAEKACQLKISIFRRLVLAGLLFFASAAQAEHYTVPLLVPAGTSSEPQGVLRILNGTDESGTVEIYAIDDAGTRSGPATFTLNASAAVQFTATDLASGNATLGLTGGIGTSVGDARLEIETDLSIVPLAFVRAADGTLSAMHDTVRAASVAAVDQYRYDVPIFNLSTDVTQVSRLRLINPGDTAAAVTIEGRDDSGAEASGGSVQPTLSAGGAQTLTAQQLEAGSTGLTGQLGAGTGKWRLTVTSDQPLQVVNIVAATAGYWNNLSTTAVPGAAPADLESLNERFIGNAVVYVTGSNRYTLNAHTGERFAETAQIDGVSTTYMGSYGYSAIGADAGRLTLTYDDGDVCAANLYFSTHTAGWFTSHCTGTDYPADGTWLGGNWSVEDDEDDGGEVVDTTYGVDDALPGVPTSGIFIPAVTSGGRVTATGAGTTIALNNGGYFELSDGTRYTCTSPAGCSIVNGAVTQGTVAGRAAGSGEVDYFPTFRTAVRPGDQTYTVGTAIDTLPLPEASSGNAPLSYSLTPSVPGLTFNATARQLAGTPSTAGTYAMTYTATDEDRDTDTLSFTITVNADTTETGSLGECYVSLLVSIGQSCTYPGTTDAFSVNERGRGSFLTFLAGIRIRITNQTINGRVYDFEASHQGDSVWRIDRIAGSTEAPETPPTTGGGGMEPEDTSPSFAADAGPGNQTYTVGTAIDTLTLPEASDGDGTLTYSLAPSVAGLTFSDGTRQLTGTPPTAGTYAMTYTVTDDDGDTDTLSFTITVEGTSDSFAPADTAAFNDRFVGKRVVGDAPAAYTDFISAGRFRETEGMESYEGSYTYTSTGATTGTVVFNYDDGDTCTSSITFAAHTTGSLSFTCNDGDSGQSSWRLTDIPGTDGGDGNSPTEIESFDLDSENRYPGGIAFANDRFYVIDDHYPDEKVFVYQANGQRDSASDFDLDPNNGSPEGITFANDRFYVVDDSSRKVFVYQATGQRDSASDFDLDSNNGSPQGITFANDTLYVIDLYDQKAYAYHASGQPDSVSDFDLDSDNRYPSGIAFANGTFYVVGEFRNDEFDNKVYAYQASGQRDPASDFNLVSDSRNRSGITFANDRFYVIDDSDGKVYVIDKSTHQLPDLALTSPAVSDTTPTSGESFVFSDTVRNRGTRPSAATTLRYYRSDSTLADGRGGSKLNLTTATEVGSDAVGALAPSETSSQMISLTTPSTAGTYYYGACVDPVSGESNTGNNCSSPVQVTVRPDLMVRSSVSETTLTSGDSFVLTATVRNGGTIASAATTLHFYRSVDRGISTADTEVGSDAVGALAPSETSSKMVSLTAPATSGTYYYGACVDYVAGESSSRNNCSIAVQVTVRAILPDLTVESPSVSDTTPASGSSFEFTATVRNQGLSASTATTLRYYRSQDRTISSRDTEVGMEAVSALSVDETVSATVSLPAPSTEGTYYYGACVDSVSGGEISTENNCSTAVVVFGGGPFPAYDLTISRTVLHAPSIVVLGTTITMTVDVTNSGPNASRPARLRFGNTVYRAIPVLDPNETVTYERQTVGSATLGTTTYRACIIEAPGEENTANNCASESVTYTLNSADVTQPEIGVSGQDNTAEDRQ